MQLDDLLAKHRREPAPHNQSHATTSSPQPEGYVAFDAKNHADFLMIRPVKLPWRSPVYQYHIDVWFGGQRTSEILSNGFPVKPMNQPKLKPLHLPLMRVKSDINLPRLVLGWGTSWGIGKSRMTITTIRTDGYASDLGAAPAPRFWKQLKMCCRFSSTFHAWII